MGWGLGDRACPILFAPLFSEMAWSYRFMFLSLLRVCFAFILGFVLNILFISQSVQAGSVDPYVLRYLDARVPVALPDDSQGKTREFSAAQLSNGKRFFEENCKNCHVGGATLPDPTVSLSLQALQGAMPPRDNIQSLVAFLRQPMTYDGSEESLYCREVPESWLPDADLGNVAGFILRSAQKAPGWGNLSF
ncbi:MAG TPA: photosystem II cytochrome PsbV2 [Trichocoleus sp.]|jgi:photosystem II cytochrome c550